MIHIVVYDPLLLPTAGVMKPLMCLGRGAEECEEWEWTDLFEGSLEKACLIYPSLLNWAVRRWGNTYGYWL